MIGVEVLELRDAPARVGVSIDCGGVATIRGTPGNDRVSIDYRPDLVLIRGGGRWWGYDPAELAGVRFAGGGGDDRVLLAIDLGDGVGWSAVFAGEDLAGFDATAEGLLYSADP